MLSALSIFHCRNYSSEYYYYEVSQTIRARFVSISTEQIGVYLALSILSGLTGLGLVGYFIYTMTDSLLLWILNCYNVGIDRHSKTMEQTQWTTSLVIFYSLYILTDCPYNFYNNNTEGINVHESIFYFTFSRAIVNVNLGRNKALLLLFCFYILAPSLPNIALSLSSSSFKKKCNMALMAELFRGYSLICLHSDCPTTDLHLPVYTASQLAP